MMAQRATPTEIEGVTESVSFRNYRHSDLQRCVEMTDRAWPELDRPISMATVEWYLASANRTEVASVGGKPVGILFGRIDREVTVSGKFSISLAHLAVYFKILFGFYGRIQNRLKVINKALTDDKNVALNTPDVDGEVVFFVVDSEHRRRGIGKALMDRFIDQAKSSGARRVSVYTTDPGSDWGFYERYGFKKQAAFRDNLLSFCRKEEVKALIYVLDLDSAMPRAVL